MLNAARSHSSTGGSPGIAVDSPLRSLADSTSSVEPGLPPDEQHALLERHALKREEQAAARLPMDTGLDIPLGVRKRVVANFRQTFGKISLVFGCIGTDLCK